MIIHYKVMLFKKNYLKIRLTLLKLIKKVFMNKNIT